MVGVALLLDPSLESTRKGDRSPGAARSPTGWAGRAGARDFGFCRRAGQPPPALPPGAARGFGCAASAGKVQLPARAAWSRAGCAVMCWVLQACLVFVILVPLAPGKHPAAEKSHWVQVMGTFIGSGNAAGPRCVGWGTQSSCFALSFVLRQQLKK